MTIDTRVVQRSVGVVHACRLLKAKQFRAQPTEPVARQIQWGFGNLSYHPVYRDIIIKEPRLMA